MILRTDIREYTGADNSVPFESHDHEVAGTPTMYLTRQEVEHGKEVLLIDVLDHLGQTGRFFLEVRISQKGAPVVIVTTKAPEGRELSKVQSGFWQKLKN